MPPCPQSLHRPEDLALVLRALGIGLAVEAMVSPTAVREDRLAQGGRASSEAPRQLGVTPGVGDELHVQEARRLEGE